MNLTDENKDLKNQLNDNSLIKESQEEKIIYGGMDYLDDVMSLKSKNVDTTNMPQKKYGD